MTTSLKLSRYTEGLKAYIDAQQAGQPTLSDTEKRSLKNTWIQLKLIQDGITIKTGQLAYDFVRFDPLDMYNPKHQNAISEVDAETLPSIDDFYLIFAVMCHLNDKAVDPDKLCMPRRSRLLAIENELRNPGTTEAPNGYAGENKASWTHEIKENWMLDKYGRPGKDTDGCYSIELESAYIILATSHIEKTNSVIKHLGRDNTQKAIRERFNKSFPTQIIKDFVAACPGCNASDKRKARIRGAATTKVAGRNRGPKNQPRNKFERATTKQLRDEFESTLRSPGNSTTDTDYLPTKRPCKDTDVNHSSHMGDSHNCQSQAPGFGSHEEYSINPLFGINDFPRASQLIVASCTQDEKLSDGNVGIAKQLTGFNNHQSHPSKAAYNQNRSVEVNGSAQPPAFHTSPRQKAFLSFMASYPRNTNSIEMDLHKCPAWLEYYRYMEHEQELFTTVREHFTRYPMDDPSSCIGYESYSRESISNRGFSQIQPQQIGAQPVLHTRYDSNGGSFNHSKNNINFNRSSSFNSPVPSNVVLFNQTPNCSSSNNLTPALTAPQPIDNFVMVDSQLYEQPFEQVFGTIDKDNASISNSASRGKSQPEIPNACDLNIQDSCSNQEINHPTSADNELIQWVFDLDAVSQEYLQLGTVSFENEIWLANEFNTNESQSVISDSCGQGLMSNREMLNSTSDDLFSIDEQFPEQRMSDSPSTNDFEKATNELSKDPQDDLSYKTSPSGLTLPKISLQDLEQGQRENSVSSSAK